MTKKKATKKATGQKSAKKGRKMRPKKELNPAEVRKQVSQIVQSEAVEMTQAVVKEGMKGQVAPVRYLFEMANIFPVQANGEQATEEEDCLAKILLSRMEAPAKPEKQQEDDETAEDVDDVKAPASTPATGGNSEKKETTETAVGMATPVT